jgi:hypothetical protein
MKGDCNPIATAASGSDSQNAVCRGVVPYIVMAVLDTSLPSQRSKLSILFTSTVRVLFTTLIFTAGAMGLGLLFGIISMVTYGLVAGVQPDMRNAYRHVAIPLAITIGGVAFVGALVLELRARRTRA